MNLHSDSLPISPECYSVKWIKTVIPPVDRVSLHPMYDSDRAIAGQSESGVEDLWWELVFSELGRPDPAAHKPKPKLVRAQVAALLDDF